MLELHSICQKVLLYEGLHLVLLITAGSQYLWIYWLIVGSECFGLDNLMLNWTMGFRKLVVLIILTGNFTNCFKDLSCLFQFRMSLQRDCLAVVISTALLSRWNIRQFNLIMSFVCYVLKCSQKHITVWKLFYCLQILLEIRHKLDLVPKIYFSVKFFVP